METRLGFRAATRIVATLFVILAIEVRGEETNLLGSVNVGLSRFWQVVESRPGPVSVVAFGDSLQVPHRSLCKYLFASLSSKLGQAGYSFSWPPAISNPVLTGGALWSPDAVVDSYSWMQYLLMPPSAMVTWNNPGQANGATLCDSMGLYYSIGPQGGLLQVDVATNGGSWSPFQSLDTYSETIETRYARWQVPLGYYQMRVRSLTGITNRVLGPEMLNSQSNGIATTYLWNNGANLQGILSLPPQVLSPVLSNIHPDLIVWHMKELSDLGESVLSNKLEQLEMFWQTVAPNAEVIYIGTPYDVVDSTNVHTEIQNRLVRNLALRTGRCYLDCMTPFGSYAEMVTNGYLDDPIHISNPGYVFMNSLVWDELCFEALRQDRRLVAQGTLEAPILSFQSFSNIEHVLQISSNLWQWSDVTSVQGDGTRKTLTNAPVLSPAFFRMLLR